MYSQMFVLSNFVTEYIGNGLGILPDIILWLMVLLGLRPPVEYHLRRIRDIVYRL